VAYPAAILVRQESVESSERRGDSTIVALPCGAPPVLGILL